MVIYKRFPEQDLAESLAKILKENNIPHSVLLDTDNLDSLYGDKNFRKEYLVRIRKEDFEKADTILLTKSREHLQAVDEDHYLFSFTDEELYDVVAKKDEWSELDFLLAQKILRDRGKPVYQQTIEKLRQERMKELAKPDEKNRVWIIIGYMSAVAGGILGILIGWHLSTFKKTLPNGDKVYDYTTRDRAHGQLILIIGVVMAVVWVIWYYNRDN
jgi:hypothetical protein